MTRCGDKMTQKESLQKVNNKIDLLIIAGKLQSAEYKRLCRLHKLLALNGRR